MKNNAIFFLCMAYILPSFSISHAQRLPYDVSAQYAEANKSYDTFQISGLSDSKLLVEVFNNFFADQLAVTKNTYTTGNDLYADRGVKEIVSSWRVGGNTEIVGSFRSAALGHQLDMLDTNTGVIVDSHRFAAGVFNTEMASESIFMGPNGGADVNFMLRGWSEWTDVIRDENGNIVDTKHNVGGLSNPIYGDDPLKNPYDMIQMIAFDVTDLVRLMYDDMSIESAYFFGWEDYTYYPNHKDIDFDYQDLTYLMINITPNTAAATPEPGTVLILGLGSLWGFSLLRYRNTKPKSPRSGKSS